VRGGEFLARFGRESIRMPGPLNWKVKFRIVRQTLRNGVLVRAWVKDTSGPCRRHCCSVTAEDIGRLPIDSAVSGEGIDNGQFAHWGRGKRAVSPSFRSTLGDSVDLNFRGQRATGSNLYSRHADVPL
jgi:hypothetical protein